VTYTYGTSKLAKVQQEVEAAKLEEAKAMAALIRQHTDALRAEYRDRAEQRALTASEQTAAFMETAELHRQWAMTRFPERWDTGQARLNAAAKEAATAWTNPRTLRNRQEAA